MMKRILLAALAVAMLAAPAVAMAVPASAAPTHPRVAASDDDYKIHMVGDGYNVGASCDSCRAYESTTGREFYVVQGGSGGASRKFELNTNRSVCMQATTNHDVVLAPCTAGGTDWVFDNVTGGKQYLLNVHYGLALAGQGCNVCYMSIQGIGAAGWFENMNIET